MADWGADPVWERSEDGRGERMVPLELLPLTQELVARLRGWAGKHDAMFDPPGADISVDPAWLDMWQQEGRKLLLAKREELGGDFDVRYALEPAV